MKIAELEAHYFKWHFIKVPEKFNVIKYIEDEQHVHDSDNDGDQTTYWAVVDDEGGAKFYKCEHSWNWTNWDSEERYLENNFIIVEVSRDVIEGEKYASKALRFVV